MQSWMASDYIGNFWVELLRMARSIETKNDEKG